jgi:hypothetical protein
MDGLGWLILECGRGLGVDHVKGKVVGVGGTANTKLRYAVQSTISQSSPLTSTQEVVRMGGAGVG